MPDWLPNILSLNDFNGNWDDYLDAVYTRFVGDFVDVELAFRGKRVALKKHPIEQGKEATFWHLISEGSIEADRIPDLRRCERIGWPRAIIDHCDDPNLKIWTERRKSEDRVHIWCEDADYLFVIADRNGYVLPWTAYPIIYPNYRVKLQKRWQNAQK